MTENIAFDLIQKYMDGWKRNDISMICSCLTENCVIIESHGPTYQGTSDLEKWFKLWVEAKSMIRKWDIQSFYFCQKEETAFAEWDFSCISNDADYAFQGISVFKISDQKIKFIHEYRMTQKPYVWEGNALQSD